MNKNKVNLSGIASDQFNQVETVLSKDGRLYLKVGQSETTKFTVSLSGRLSNRV
jgi:hypothetical protein